MVLYTGSDPDQRWESLQQYYDPTAAEVAYATNLPGFLLNDFRLYCIGYKLLHGISNLADDTTQRRFVEDDNREELVELAQENPDPRLKRENFAVTDRVREYVDELARYEGDAAEELKFFIWGATIRYPDWDPDTVIEAWHGPYKDTLIDIGKTFRQHALDVIGRDISSDRDHRFYKKKNDDAVHLPDATPGDISFLYEQLVQKMKHLKKKGRWEFERCLSQNGVGMKSRVLHLFCCKDNNGNVVDRMVIKIVSGAPDEINEVGNAEFGLHKKLFEISAIKPEFIAECYAWSIRERPGKDVWLANGYLEHCSLGDLAGLVTDKGPDTAQIPEFFIWLTIRSLASSILLLHAGLILPASEPSSDASIPNSSIPGALPPDQWTPLINLDIKTHNVCLATPQLPYPAFPIPKTIDFGLCYPPSDPFLSTQRRINHGSPGTNGWKPPEQSRNIYNPDYYARNAVSVATSIANVGLVALNLMEGKPISFPAYDGAARDYPPLDDFTDEYDNVYSSQLVELVWRCLSRETADRPRLWEMLFEARKGLERWQVKNGGLVGRGLEEVDGRERMVRDGGMWWIGRKEEVEGVEGGSGEHRLGSSWVTQFSLGGYEDGRESERLQSPPKLTLATGTLANLGVLEPDESWVPV